MKKIVLAAALIPLLSSAAGGASPALAAVSSVRAIAATAAAVAATAPLRLEPLGSSFTYGSHSSAGNGYRGPLWDALTNSGHQLDFVGSVHEGTMADSDNEGHPGWRIDALQSIATNSVTTYRPNVVTLIAGTNDLIQNHDVATAPDRLGALVDQVLAASAGVTVVVADLPVSTNANVVAFRPAYNAGVAQMVQAKQAAGKHVTFVSMSAITSADIGPDGIHPGDAGYQKMADTWNKGIQTAVTAGWITPPANIGSPVAQASGEVVAGVAAGKCLDVNGANATDGTRVQLWTCNHSPAQPWTAYSDSTLRVLGKCLAAVAGGTANGTKTELRTCNGSGAQIWQSANGGYVNIASGRCLDDPNSTTTDGTGLQLWDCGGGANQRWAPPGLGAVFSGIAGKCLEGGDGASVNGTKVDISDCTGSHAQQWVLRYSNLQISGLCLDVNGGLVANGTIVQLWDCSGTAGQVWRVGSNGSLVNPQSGRCLDDPGFTTVNGTQLKIWDCNGGINQKWTPPTF